MVEKHSAYRILILFVVAVFFAQSVSAQLLWRISGKGIKEDSYIFGTHHLMSSKILEDVPGVFRAYNESEVVVGELVIDEKEMTAKLLGAAQSGEDLRNYLSATEISMVDSVLRGVLQVGLSSLSYFRPAMITYMYEISLYEKLHPREDVDMVDSFFQQIAMMQGMQVVGLESVDEQIDLLMRSKSVKRQAQELVEAIKKGDAIVRDYEQMERLYRRGDLDSLYTIGRQEMSEAEMYQMVTARNEMWVEKLNDIMRKNRCFIAVGALHLPGSDGLLELLRRKGYKVSAVR